MPPTPCLESRCPQRAVLRGRCELHRRSEAERGYGAEWRAVRSVVRSEVRACEECGTTVDLTVDHIVPQSLGGTDVRSNLRVLCRSCHSAVGVRSNAGSFTS